MYKMKKLFIGLFLVFFGTNLFAQGANDYLEVSRDVIKTEKKAAIAGAMQLTDTESQVFWPLYNEYNEKMYVINTELFNAIKDFAKHYETMTDEKALELWANAEKVESELFKLKKTYFKKFLKIMPPTKTVRYFQAENKIKTLIDAELAQEIPLFEEMK